ELSCSGAVFGKCRSHGPFRRPGISRGSLAEKRKKIIIYEECMFMKKTKIAAMLLVTFTALSLGACGGQSSGQGNSSEATASGDSRQEQSTASDSGNGGTQDNTEASAEGTTGGGNVLIAYFSVPETDGVDTVSGASRVAVDGEVLGN